MGSIPSLWAGMRQRRKSPRYKLLSMQLPGQLYVSDTRQPVFAVAVDVSKDGLGIVTGTQFEPESQLLFEIDDKLIPLRVVWNKKSKARRFRHGLQVVGGAFDLEELFFACGVLDVDLGAL